MCRQQVYSIFFFFLNLILFALQKYYINKFYYIYNINIYKYILAKYSLQMRMETAIDAKENTLTFELH